MCTQDCQTWLWGGGGSPIYDGEGQCSCACDDERWSDHNLLGRASCVPVMAHLIFGWVGLALSVAALCQVVYQLYRQLKFHAQELLASTLPVEKCRRNMHLLVVTFDVMCLGFFGMVLGDKLPWSVVLLSAMQIPSNLSGVMGTRVWIYTTGHGLVDRIPEMLAFSAWLETPAGRYASLSAVSIAPGTAAILAAIGHPEMAMKTTAAGILFVTTIVSGVFCKCAKSLIRVIDESIENKKNKKIAQGNEKATDHRDPGDAILLASRRKAKWMLGFFSRQLVLNGSVLVFAIFSKYGTAAPLLLFDLPMAIVTILKLVVGVQVFAGRSKLNASQGLRFYIGLKRQRQFSRTSTSLTNARYSMSRKGRVVPTEEHSVLDHAMGDTSRQVHLELT